MIHRQKVSDFWFNVEPTDGYKQPEPIEPATCATCGGKGFYWFLSLGRRVRVRCLACTPAPVDPWKFHS